ncbi:hypothetical protein ACFS07_01695 [Undibacterium arcticum]
MPENIRSAAVDIASYILTGLALMMVLHLNLLAALFSGLLVYSLVHLMTPALGKNISSDRARMIVVAALSLVIVAFWSIAIWAGVSFFSQRYRPHAGPAAKKWPTFSNRRVGRCRPGCNSICPTMRWS